MHKLQSERKTGVFKEVHSQDCYISSVFKNMEMIIEAARECGKMNCIHFLHLFSINYCFPRAPWNRNPKHSEGWCRPCKESAHWDGPCWTPDALMTACPRHALHHTHFVSGSFGPHGSPMRSLGLSHLPEGETETLRSRASKVTQ